MVAVGTTATRTLESLPHLWKILPIAIKHSFQIEIQNFWDTILLKIPQENWIQISNIPSSEHAFHFETSIYITPGYTFQIVDDLITNFHLGESSLLVLVSAFLGYHETQKVYQYAIKQQYRFYSFGDGMYIRRS